MSSNLWPFPGATETGDKGGPVAAWQARLAEDGFLDPDRVNGVHDEATDEALTELAYALEADGGADEGLWSAWMDARGRGPVQPALFPRPDGPDGPVDGPEPDVGPEGDEKGDDDPETEAFGDE